VSAKIDPVEVASMCRHPKCDVCGADAKADATPRTEVTDMKWTGCVRVWPDKPNVQSHEVFDLVDKSKLDAEIATFRAKLAAVCRAGETLASEVLDICEDPYCDGPRCLACFALKAAIAAAGEREE